MLFMRQKKTFAVQIIYEKGKQPKKNGDSLLSYRRISTTGFHALISEFNRTPAMILMTVKKAIAFLLFVFCLSSCSNSRPIARAYNKTVSATYIGFTHLPYHWLQVNVITSCGDTVHVKSWLPERELRRWKPGRLFLFNYDSTRHTPGDTLHGNLSFNPIKQKR